MMPGNHAKQGPDDEPRSDESSRSFHGELLNRSRSAPPPSRRGPLGRIAGRGARAAFMGRLGRLCIEATIFAGGLAIGAGVVLRLAGQGEPIRVRPVVLIAAGLACVLLTIFARLLAWARPRPIAQPARG